MVIFYILYLLIFIVITIAGLICLRIKSSGMNVKDFFEFVLAINDLDDLYVYSKNNIKMTDKEQLLFLKQAEEIFKKFEKVPSMIWEDEYEKYEQVLETYKNIRLLKWSEIAV